MRLLWGLGYSGCNDTFIEITYFVCLAMMHPPAKSILRFACKINFCENLFEEMLMRLSFFVSL